MRTSRTNSRAVAFLFTVFLFTVLLFTVFLCVQVALFSPIEARAQTPTATVVATQPTGIQSKEIRHLLGKCRLEDFQQLPFQTWFQEGFRNYSPNAPIVQELKQTPLARLRFKVFLGTWCGDSQREFPRFAKLASELGIREEAIEIIAVNSADSLRKRSPTGEEVGQDIFRVPTVLIFEQSQNKKQEWHEKARIVEYPSETWERDLVRIQRGEDFPPAYPSYPVVREWLKNGILSDTNMSASGLATRLKHVVSSESELNAAVYVLLARGQTQEAVLLARVNANIFPQSSNCYDTLGECYEKVGKFPQAVRALERALELDVKNSAALAALVRVKSKK